MALKKITLYLILIFICTSCSPKMHALGIGVRVFNISQNKYSKKNPYLKTKSAKEKDTTSRTH